MLIANGGGGVRIITCISLRINRVVILEVSVHVWLLKFSSDKMVQNWNEWKITNSRYSMKLVACVAYKSKLNRKQVLIAI